MNITSQFTDPSAVASNLREIVQPNIKDGVGNIDIFVDKFFKTIDWWTAHLARSLTYSGVLGIISAFILFLGGSMYSGLIMIGFTAVTLIAPFISYILFSNVQEFGNKRTELKITLKEVSEGGEDLTLEGKQKTGFMGRFLDMKLIGTIFMSISRRNDIATEIRDGLVSAVKICTPFTLVAMFTAKFLIVLHVAIALIVLISI